MAEGLALVTGASSGIGFVLAKLFADHGYDLVVAADDDAIQASADKLGAAGASVSAVQVDLRKPDEVELVSRTATGAGRSLDVAVLNAGVGRAGPFVAGDLDTDLSIVDVNVRSTAMPGPTDTDFFRRGRMLETVVGRMPKNDPGEVAIGLANRMLPDSVKAAASRMISFRVGRNERSRVR
jgi:NAD(P)-dependent dehydrogenase (short-subunit alcohol dehydrogenase family)